MGKIGMSVLVKGLAMDFERQGRTEMAITAIWPAAASAISFRIKNELIQSRLLTLLRPKIRPSAQNCANRQYSLMLLLPCSNLLLLLSMAN